MPKTVKNKQNYTDLPLKDISGFSLHQNTQSNQASQQKKGPAGRYPPSTNENSSTKQQQICSSGNKHSFL
jgi:hypothetical protein